MLDARKPMPPSVYLDFFENFWGMVTGSPGQLGGNFQVLQLVSSGACNYL
jgi:hypothetical protein